MEMEVIEKQEKQKKSRVKVNTKVMLFGGGMGHIGEDLASVLKGVSFERVNLTLHAFNTDEEDLDAIQDQHDNIQIMQIGEKATNGYGAGANPALGRAAAEENQSDIIEPMKEADILIIGACLGGGTGSGASPYAAEQFAAMTKDQSNLPLPQQKAGLIIVTMPFSSQDPTVQNRAKKAYEDLLATGIPILVLPNDNFLPPDDVSQKMSMLEMWRLGNKPIAYLIARMVRALGKRHDLMNIDRNDIVSHLIMRKNESSLAYFGVGYAKQDQSIAEALEMAAQNSYLETGLWSCRRAIISVDAIEPTAHDFQVIQQFTQQRRQLEDAEWRCGINGSFEPLSFEKEGEYKAAVFIIGTGCELGTEKFIDPRTDPQPVLVTELVQTSSPKHLQAVAKAKPVRQLSEAEVEAEWQKGQAPKPAASAS